VFPLRGKVPIVRHGLNDATTDPGRVRQWWQRHPDANLGLTTGGDAGIWVLDVDVHDPSKNGLVSMAGLEDEHGELPDTLTIRTGSGGLHLYWAMPQGRDIRNRTAVAPGIDVRGTGGYVVAPPSIHPDTGEQYRVPDEGRHRIATPPDWLVDLVAPLQPRRRPSPQARTGVRLPPGDYHREAARRLRQDPGTRERLAERLGAQLVGSGENRSAKGVRCPQCGRPSVWWPIAPRCPSGTARCAHLNSCGWWGSLADLIGGISG